MNRQGTNPCICVFTNYHITSAKLSLHWLIGIYYTINIINNQPIKFLHYQTGQISIHCNRICIDMLSQGSTIATGTLPRYNHWLVQEASIYKQLPQGHRCDIIIGWCKKRRYTGHQSPQSSATITGKHTHTHSHVTFNQRHHQYTHRFHSNICTRTPSRSMTCCGMHSTGLIVFNSSNLFCSLGSCLPTISNDVSNDNPVSPNSVWNGSATSPGLSEIPPVSLSCEQRMKLINLLPSIHDNLPSMASDASTHLNER